MNHLNYNPPMKENTMNQQTKTIHRTFKMDATLDRKIAQIAQIKGISRSAVIRDALQYFTDNWIAAYQGWEAERSIAAMQNES